MDKAGLVPFAGDLVATQPVFHASAAFYETQLVLALRR
jgi:hypothetical protein